MLPFPISVQLNITYAKDHEGLEIQRPRNSPRSQGVDCLNGKGSSHAHHFQHNDHISSHLLITMHSGWAAGPASTGPNSRRTSTKTTKKVDTAMLFIITFYNSIVTIVQKLKYWHFPSTLLKRQECPWVDWQSHFLNKTLQTYLTWKFLLVNTVHHIVNSRKY